MHQLYKNIKDLRLKAGLTQADLAKKVGYTDRTSVTKIEKGEGNLSATKIEKFAEALGTSPAALMGWEEPNPKTEKLSPIRQEFLDKVDGMTEEQLKKLNDLLDAFLLQKK